MFSEVDVRFELIFNIFKANQSSTSLIEKAYKTAKVLHKDQLRKDGKPYISHPVEVALILAELGFGENVVSAALLHDVVEDCGFTYEDIKTQFNEEVADLVDCVSAIDKTKYISLVSLGVDSVSNDLPNPIKLGRKTEYYSKAENYKYVFYVTIIHAIFQEVLPLSCEVLLLLQSLQTIFYSQSSSRQQRNHL